MIPLKHHSTLTLEKWQTFGTEKQILMIANEVQRSINGIENQQDEKTIKDAMERGLELTDITCTTARPQLQKELLRWRDLFGQAYLILPEAEILKKLLRSLVLLNGASAKMLAIA